MQQHLILHTAAVHLRLFSCAAGRPDVKKRKCDSIALTFRDNLHWLSVRQRVYFKISSTGLHVQCLQQLAAPYIVTMISPVLAVLAKIRRPVFFVFINEKNGIYSDQQAEVPEIRDFY